MRKKYLADKLFSPVLGSNFSSQVSASAYEPSMPPNPDEAGAGGHTDSLPEAPQIILQGGLRPRVTRTAEGGSRPRISQTGKLAANNTTV